MTIDYLDNINEYGEDVVRLYDFGGREAIQFKEVLEELIASEDDIDLLSCDFIKSRNCELIMRISDVDEGITSVDNVHFICDMTPEGYQHMIMLLAPFCAKETKGYQFLYDLDTPTDFLFSPAGTW